MFEDNENLLNLLFEAASEGIIVVDEAQTIIASNLTGREYNEAKTL